MAPLVPDTPESAVDLRALKRKLSPRLLTIRGVSGVGIPGGTLTVYLAEDSEKVRRVVDSVLESESPGIAVRYIVSGEFRPL